MESSTDIPVHFLNRPQESPSNPPDIVPESRMMLVVVVVVYAGVGLIFSNLSQGCCRTAAPVLRPSVPTSRYSPWPGSRLRDPGCDWSKDRSRRPQNIVSEYRRMHRTFISLGTQGVRDIPPSHRKDSSRHHLQHLTMVITFTLLTGAALGGCFMLSSGCFMLQNDAFALLPCEGR